MKLCICMWDTCNWCICMWGTWHWCICIRDTCNDGTDEYACEWNVTYHGFTAQVGVHFGDLVLVHIIQFGMCLLSCVDHVFLEKLLLYRLHIQCVLHLLQHCMYTLWHVHQLPDSLMMTVIMTPRKSSSVNAAKNEAPHWLVTSANWPNSSTDWCSICNRITLS